MNTIKLYGFVNALMMAIFGFCSSSVMLQQYKAASPEQYLLVCILGLVVISGVSYVLTFAKLSAEVMRYSTTVVLLDAIAYASIDYYTAATGDLQTRWLANTLLLSVTQSLKSKLNILFYFFLSTYHKIGNLLLFYYRKTLSCLTFILLCWSLTFLVK